VISGLHGIPTGLNMSGLMTMDTIRVALIDDHELFRSALGRTLRDYGFQVVAEGGDARATFAQIDAQQPELVLLDLRLPAMDGITALRELRSRNRQLKIVMLSSSESLRDVSAAWSAGVHGYATKMLSVERLVGGLRKVIAGERFLQDGLEVDESDDRDPLSPLSGRERDIFRLVVRGMSSLDVSKQLHISPKTVDTHRERILKKLALHSVVQLVRFAAAHGLLDS
jgi:DNA-binding NarL/FixJ family response regulator